MADPVAELDQVLPVAKALAIQDARVVAAFYVTLRQDIEHPYDVLELTREYLVSRLERRADDED